MAKNIAIDVSKSVVYFNPEKHPECFTVTVYNNSYRAKEKSCFASFQLSLLAAARKDLESQDWYRLVPAVSYKIPPGDRIQFQIEILAVPPVSEDFVGTLPLTIKVYSPELQEHDVENILLTVQGESLRSPKLSLSAAEFEALPNEQTEINIALYNPNRKSTECSLKLNGLESEWLPEGNQKKVLLFPGEQKELSFICQIPPPLAALSQTYPLTFDIVHPVVVATAAEASLTVLPAGSASFSCHPLEQWLPQKRGRWINTRQGEATVDLSFDNQSNLTLEGNIEVFSEASLSPAESSSHQVIVQSGETAPISLRIRQRLPWLGWARRRQLQLKASVSEPQITLQAASQTVVLRAAPVIPVWLQLLGASVGVILLTVLAYLFTHRGHSESVNSVQINGQSNEVISASDDQTLRRWRIENDRLVPAGIVLQGDKSIRTASYRPVNNDEIVAAFENGSLEIVNNFSDQTSILNENSDDRVLDTVFSRDARVLYSAHGSGQIYRWPIALNNRRSIYSEADSVLANDDDPFAIYALALVGNNNSQLAIAGEYNKFKLVNLETGNTVDLPYLSQGRQTDLITDVATAEAQPNQIATADNQGMIAIWDLEQCQESPTDCQPVDQWTGHGGSAVWAIAFSQDGCYLASAGDDKQVRLWPLSDVGTRQSYALEGRLLRQSTETINAVDISQQPQQLQIVSGGDDHQIKLNNVKIPNNRQPLGSCLFSPE